MKIGINNELLISKENQYIFFKPVFEDDKEFSKNFYVVTNDALKPKLQIMQSFGNYIQNIRTKDFLIEIIGNKNSIIKNGDGKWAL